jgi:hypothetical protein
MKARKSTVLKLNRETVRELGAAELREAEGGSPSNPCIPPTEFGTCRCSIIDPRCFY